MKTLQTLFKTLTCSVIALMLSSTYLLASGPGDDLEETPTDPTPPVGGGGGVVVGGGGGCNCGNLLPILEKINQNTKTTADATKYIEKMMYAAKKVDALQMGLQICNGRSTTSYAAFEEKAASWSAENDGLNQYIRFLTTGSDKFQSGKFGEVAVVKTLYGVFFNPTTGRLERAPGYAAYKIPFEIQSYSGLREDPVSMDPRAYATCIWISNDGTVGTALTPPRQIRTFKKKEEALLILRYGLTYTATVQGKSLANQLIDSLSMFWNWDKDRGSQVNLKNRFYIDSTTLNIPVAGGLTIDMIPTFVSSGKVLIVGDNAVIRKTDPLDKYYMGLSGVDFSLLNNADTYHPLIGSEGDGGSSIASVNALKTKTFYDLVSGKMYKNPARKFTPGLKLLVKSGYKPELSGDIIEKSYERLFPLKIGDVPTKVHLEEAASLFSNASSQWLEAVKSVPELTFNNGTEDVTYDVANDMSNPLPKSPGLLEFGDNVTQPNVSNGAVDVGIVYSIGLPAAQERNYVSRMEKAKHDLERNIEAWLMQEVMAAYTKDIITTLTDLLQTANDLRLALNDGYKSDVGFKSDAVAKASQGVTQMVRDYSKEIIDHRKTLGSIENRKSKLMSERSMILTDMLDEKQKADETLKGMVPVEISRIQSTAGSYQQSQANLPHAQ